ncbi:MAG: DUF2007 domain-containing protein [Bacteroidota bacterium]|nr:DUF2007 domain-containing protein [Bacteroidota bacterium]
MIQNINNRYLTFVNHLPLKINHYKVESDWIKIYSSSAIFKAEMVKLVLHKNGIKAVLINKQDSNYLFGEVEVYVLSKDVIESKKIIKDNDL